MATPLPARPREWSALSRMTRRLQRWFITGLILIAPAFVTFVALRWIFNHIDRPLRLALAQLTGYDIPGAGLISTLLLLLAAGAVGSSFAMRGLVRGAESLFDRIPLVRTIYSGVKQLVAPLGDEHGSSFQKVVLVRYPDAETWSLGFLIRRDAGVSPTGEMLSAVLVPTNHLHLGNVVLVGSQPADGCRPERRAGSALPGLDGGGTRPPAGAAAASRRWRRAGHTSRVAGGGRPRADRRRCQRTLNPTKARLGRLRGRNRAGRAASPRRPVPRRRSSRR